MLERKVSGISRIEFGNGITEIDGAFGQINFKFMGLLVVFAEIFR